MSHSRDRHVPIEVRALITDRLVSAVDGLLAVKQASRFPVDAALHSELASIVVGELDAEFAGWRCIEHQHPVAVWRHQARGSEVRVEVKGHSVAQLLGDTIQCWKAHVPGRVQETLIPFAGEAVTPAIRRLVESELRTVLHTLWEGWICRWNPRTARREWYHRDAGAWSGVPCMLGLAGR